MTVNKITTPITPLELIDKTNEIIDNLGGGSLEGLSDVTISNPSQGQNLTYDATNQVWKNTSTSATVAWGGITGTLADQTDLQNALDGKQATLRAGTGISISSSNTIATTDPVLINNAASSSNGVAIKGSGTVQSTQLGALGSASSMSTSVGFSSYASGSQSISIGHGSQATEAHSYSFGEQAKSTAKGAFQFGYGTNNEAGTVQFGLNTGDDNSDTVNYKLLGSDGIIPNARINMDTTPTSASTNTITSGAVYTALSSKQDTIDANNKLDYAYLSNTPTIPTVNNATLTITQGGTSKGTFTANASSDVTIALDAGGSSLTAGTGIDINSNDEIDIIQLDPTIIYNWTTTTVGSPTNNNGVWSNFSSANYLTFAKPTASISSLECYFNFTTGSLGVYEVLISGNEDASSSKRGISIGIKSNRNIVFECRDENDTYHSVTMTTTLTDATEYTFKINFSNGTITGTLYNSYNTLLETVTVSSSTLRFNMDERIGNTRGTQGNNPFSGSINLKGSYIKVNGNLLDATSTVIGGDVAKATSSLYGLVKPDNSTITVSNGVIETDAVIDNRSGSAIKTWTGTRSQYDAIVTKDANTLYNITDDTDVTLSLLELLYPVGSIYIGTMATCPLATLGIGTWQLVAAGRVLQGADSGQTVGDTVEAGLPNIGIYTEYGTNSNLNQSPTSDNYMQLAGVSAGTRSLKTNLTYTSVNETNTVQPPAYLVNIWERTA